PRLAAARAAPSMHIWLMAPTMTTSLTPASSSSALRLVPLKALTALLVTTGSLEFMTDMHDRFACPTCDALFEATLGKLIPDIASDPRPLCIDSARAGPNRLPRDRIGIIAQIAGGILGC